MTGTRYIPTLCMTKKPRTAAITLVKVKQPGSYRLEKVPVEALRAVIGEGIG